ncbi:MAG: tetratricopeptide repeat protein [Thermodesulfobacteriota bacterium]
MRRIALLLGVGLSLTSCAARPQTVAPRLAEPAAAQEPADTGCSYFYFLWGRNAETRGAAGYEEAQEAYEKALVCDPGATRIRQNLLLLLIRMGQRQRAIDHLETLIEKFPADSRYVMLLASIHESEGQHDRSRAVYEEALRKTPGSRELLLAAGGFFVKIREYERARNLYEEASRLDPAGAEPHVQLGRMYREMRLGTKAVAAYEKALALEWSPATAVEAADLYEVQRLFDKAWGLYQRMLDEAEDPVRLQLKMVGLSLKMGKVDQALALLGELRADAYDEDRQQIDFSIGSILLDQKRYPEAIEHFRRLTEEYPDLVRARTMLAFAHYESGDVEGAIRELSGETGETGDGGELALMLAHIYIEEKRFDDADELLTIHIEQGSEPLAEFYSAKAALLQKLERHDEADKLFEEAIGLFPENEDLLFEYGVFLQERGREQDAIAAMERIIDFAPENPFALNFVGYSWADRGERLEDARAYIEKAVSIRPEDGFIRDSLGWVYLRLGRMQDALRELELAAQLTPDDPTILDHLGEVYHRLGRLDDARRSWQKAYELEQTQERKSALGDKLRQLLAPRQ